MNIIPLILAAILSLIHYFSEEISEKVKNFHEEIISFSAGLFITLIFIFLMPEFFSGQESIGEMAFLLMLSGFVFFHIAEKYVYQHVKNKNKMLKDLAEIHALGFFVDHFVLGITLALVFQSSNILFSFAVFVPMILHTLASSLSLTHIDKYFKKAPLLNISLSISPFLGVLFATLIQPDKQIYYAIFSLVIGALLYISIRDMLPEKREGKLVYFVLGFILSILMIYGIKYLIAF